MFKSTKWTIHHLHSKFCCVCCSFCFLNNKNIIQNFVVALCCLLCYAYCHTQAILPWMHLILPGQIYEEVDDVFAINRWRQNLQPCSISDADVLVVAKAVKSWNWIVVKEFRPRMLVATDLGYKTDHYLRQELNNMLQRAGLAKVRNVAKALNNF